MSQAFFRKILVRHGRPLRAEYEEPFAYLLSSNKYSLRGSHKSTIVELRGREPGASRATGGYRGRNRTSPTAAWKGKLAPDPLSTSRVIQSSQ